MVLLCCCLLVATFHLCHTYFSPLAIWRLPASICVVSESFLRAYCDVVAGLLLHRVIITDPENNNKMADAYQPPKLYHIIEQRNKIKSFLGAACSSPYIVFISTSGM